eukprot:TRINITY_DN61381_c0_g1_i1.p1 TRINITY_DN61381_c0_g1~~TRINITY_DN61381_c0_g1_i1.p1  ORF type:complete len:561 (+),score=112.73 TRINITY_DN61381_c0_g1_i1:205-1683(+)
MAAGHVHRVKSKPPLFGWKLALLCAIFTASAVVLAVRWHRGRAGKTGILVATASGAATLYTAYKRWRLKPITNDSIIRSVFSETTADFFLALPEAISSLQGRLEDSEIDVQSKSDDVLGVQFFGRLVSLSCSGERRPYSEARALLQESSELSREVPAAELEEAVKLLAFAEATYENDELVRQTCDHWGYKLLYLEPIEEAGAPAHFLCFDANSKHAILSVRGTKTPRDALTDLNANVQEISLSSGSQMFAHKGFLASAQSVLERVSPVLTELLGPLGYSLTLTGHSLGASTASLLTVLLSAEKEKWKAPMKSLRCVAFAPCPCMDSETAQRCITGGPSLPLITSYVCNFDLVPRVSTQNIQRLFLLGKGASVEEVLKLASDKNARAFDQHIPGQVVMLHEPPPPESSKDVHESAPEGEEKRPAEWKAWYGNSLSFPEISYLELARESVAHHMAPVYREAIAVTAAAHGVNVPVAVKVNETYPSWFERLGEHE